jgi:hypothetical protein
MFKICGKVLSVLLLVLVVVAPLGCLSINKPPSDQPKTEVNVGGEHGVTVDHPSGD